MAFNIPLTSKKNWHEATDTECFELRLFQFFLCCLARFSSLSLFHWVRLLYSAVSAVRLDCTYDILVFLCFFFFFFFFAALTVILFDVYASDQQLWATLHIPLGLRQTITSRCQTRTQQVHTWPSRTCWFICN